MGFGGWNGIKTETNELYCEWVTHWWGRGESILITLENNILTLLSKAKHRKELYTNISLQLVGLFIAEIWVSSFEVFYAYSRYEQIRKA